MKPIELYTIFYKPLIFKIMMLGNLTVQEIEKRLGIDFPEKVKKLMEKTMQPNAQHIVKGK